VCLRIINIVSCLVYSMNLFELFLIHSRASDFGLLKIDQSGKIIQFSEKPKGDDLKAMVMIYFVCQNVSFLLAILRELNVFCVFSKLTLPFLVYHRKKLRSPHTLHRWVFTYLEKRFC